MKPLSIRSACLVAFLIAIACQAGWGADLSWKFQPGQKWNVTLQGETNSTSVLDTRTLRTRLETSVETEWTIDAVNDGTAELTQQILRLRMTGTGVDGVGILFDSAATEKPVGPAKEIAAAVAPYVGAKVHCKMNARGEISDVVPSAELAKLLEAEQEFASQPSLALDLLQQPLCLVPGKEVATDATWEHERKLKLPTGVFMQHQTYALAAEDPNRALPAGQVRITVTASLKPVDTMKKSPLQAQEQSGEFLFDATAGLLVRSIITQKLTVSNPFRDKEIIVKTTSERRIELKPSGP